MKEYQYSSVQRYQDREDQKWLSHVHTNDLDGAQDIAEIDHDDHPEHGHGVMDWQKNELVFRLPAQPGK
jgi:hypothetical protein